MHLGFFEELLSNYARTLLALVDANVTFAPWVHARWCLSLRGMGRLLGFSCSRGSGLCLALLGRGSSRRRGSFSCQHRSSSARE